MRSGTLSLSVLSGVTAFGGDFRYNPPITWLRFGSETMPECPQKILVFDDEPEIRKLIATALRLYGYTVLTADTGENAISLFEQNPGIDLLLTDVVSPGMSGPMIADAVTALQPAIKVLFMSGYTNPEIERRYVIGRGYGLLEKPFTMDQLEKKIRSILGGGETATGGSA